MPGPGRGKPSEHKHRAAATHAAAARRKHAAGRSSTAGAHCAACRAEQPRTSAQGDNPEIRSMIPLSSAGGGSGPPLGSGGTMRPPGGTLGPASRSAAVSTGAARLLTRRKARQAVPAPRAQLQAHRPRGAPQAPSCSRHGGARAAMQRGSAEQGGARTRPGQLRRLFLGSIRLGTHRAGLPAASHRGSHARPPRAKPATLCGGVTANELASVWDPPPRHLQSLRERVAPQIRGWMPAARRRRRRCRRRVAARGTLRSHARDARRCTGRHRQA
jgi:hypothetical protein